MTPPEDLAIIRSAYAKHMMAAAGADDPAVEAAYAETRREDFLGPGPWPILRWGRGYVPTPSADPVYLYTDDLVGIVPDWNLNNGQPSFHAPLIISAGLRRGEHVVHIGAGVGYYTAILAHLVGPAGKVTAIEFEPDLARRARSNLANLAQVTVLAGDGTSLPFDDADIIYVNAGVTRPADIWLDRLADGGRLILPLTTSRGFQWGEPDKIKQRGAVFRIERRGLEFLAKWISAVAIFPCAGGRDEAAERALATALGGGGWERVTRLRRGGDIPEERCWLKAAGWCLTYD
jgi:protein-L-isoaspartate(D-aspartate) O-methyltransferase